MASYSTQIHCLCAVLIIFATCAFQSMSLRSLHDRGSGTGVSLSVEGRHEQWMIKYGRIYKSDTEKQMRFQVFKDNTLFIDNFNKNGDRSYVLSVNEIADLKNEEFIASRNGLKKPTEARSSRSFRYENVTDVPSSMDWRKKGAVTPIKDQGQCGSCWAFSAVAAVEGITKLSTGKLISLSEQEVVDCDTSGVDNGCGGGEMEDAFEFIKQNKGLTTEANYPYKAADGTCNRKKAASSVADINGYEIVPANSETDLLKAVANQPISVSVDASAPAFQFYSNGVLTGECGTDLDHGVTTVGYGTTSDGTRYWLVKNSWGTTWGEDGYIRMERDINAKEGMCGIAMDSSYPTV